MITPGACAGFAGRRDHTANPPVPATVERVGEVAGDAELEDEAAGGVGEGAAEPAGGECC